MWALLTEAGDAAVKNVGIYEQLCAIQNPEAQDNIECDVPRTFPNHPLFTGNGNKKLGGGTDLREKLRRLLTAYANFKEYSQSLSYIAAVLLMVTDEEVRNDFASPCACLVGT